MNKYNSKLKYKFKTKFIHYIFKVLLWMDRLFFRKEKPSSPSCAKLYGPLLKRMDRVLYARGPSCLINDVKEVRRLYLAYLAGNPDKSILVKTTKDGIPLVLGDCIPHIRRGVSASNIRTTRLLTTVLWATRSLKARSPMDLSSIITPSERPERNAYGQYIHDF